ncbi:hypothetical protein AURDEDRAFT_176293, partial [Auricularia subglabra TFB-10046 SS5]
NAAPACPRLERAQTPRGPAVLPPTHSTPASVHLGGPVLRRPALSTSANIGAGHAHTLLLASMPEPAQTPPEPHCSPIDFPP